MARIEQLGEESLLSPQEGDPEPLKQFKHALMDLARYMNTTLGQEILVQREKINNVHMMDQKVLAGAFLIYNNILIALKSKKSAAAGKGKSKQKQKIEIPKDFMELDEDIYHQAADKVVEQMVRIPEWKGTHTPMAIQSQALLRYLDIIWQTLQPFSTK